MSSSEEDEESMRLEEAVASNFTIRPNNSASQISSATPERVENGDEKRVVDKPSLRLDEWKETTDSTDSLDSDGFSQRFKDHLSKKLGSKLEKQMEINENGEIAGTDVPFLRPIDGESDREDAIQVFSFSKRDRVVESRPIEKKRKRRIEEVLRKIHLKKKNRAVGVSTVGFRNSETTRVVMRNGEAAPGSIENGKTNQYCVDDDVSSNKSASDSSDEEDASRLASVAVSGAFILNSANLVTKVNVPQLDVSTEVSNNKKKKKKKKKKKRNDDAAETGVTEATQTSANALNLAASTDAISKKERKAIAKKKRREKKKFTIRDITVQTSDCNSN